MYQCKHFRSEELVPPEVFEELKNDLWRLWMQFDDFFLMGLDLVREHFGVPITINDYAFGGHTRQRVHEVWTRCGLRTYPLLSGESKWGMHQKGKGGDLHLKGVTAEQARQEILKNKEKFCRLIRRMEKDVPWLHVDRGNYGDDPKMIYLIGP